ncbi:alpha/beta hydrolase [Spirosoma arcticum]
MQSLKGETTILRYRHRAANQANPPLLLLLHGVGSNEEGLLGLFGDVDPRFLVVSAQAPFPMGPERYGWYAVDFSSGSPVINAEQADKSRLILVQFISQLAERHGINRQRVYLLGFSQGGVMSYHLALTNPDRVAGAVVIGGRILDQTKQRIARPGLAASADHSTETLKKLTLYVAHGQQDTVLPIWNTRDARTYLSDLGVAVQYQEYPTGHHITADIQHDVKQWLADRWGKLD